MKTYEDVSRMLEEIIDETPEQLFEGLTGGVLLSEQYKLHPQSKPGSSLYIMGEYRTNITGSRIVIYYGSFMAVYGYLDSQSFPLVKRLNSYSIFSLRLSNIIYLSFLYPGMSQGRPKLLFRSRL